MLVMAGLALPDFNHVSMAKKVAVSISGAIAFCLLLVTHARRERTWSIGLAPMILIMGVMLWIRK